MSFYPPWAGFTAPGWLAHRVGVLYGPETPVELVLSVPELRRDLCADDPALFAWVYLARHLRMPDGTITYAQFHLEWNELARGWMAPDDTGVPPWRHAFIAPRASAKSTVWFTLIPLWALAYGHARFVAAFANSAGQSEMHLATFKRELDTNALLRADFPDLCAPAKRPGGTQVADRQGMLHTRSGAVFAARGVDSPTLGMKVENRRPDVIVLDDLEPDEATYSGRLAEKRLGTLVDALLPLNIRARVALAGTITMPGSITHQLVQAAQGGDVPEWVATEAFTVHHHQPFTVADDGTESSVWPEKWPTEWLLARRHTREFAKNMSNDPLSRDGDYWTADDFRYGALPALTHQLLSIDPAVKAKQTSDFTALAVIGYYAPERRAVVRDAWAVRIPPGEALRARVLAILGQYPDVAGVLVETVQGGDAWKAILHTLGVPLRTVHPHEPKEVRAARLLNHYQRGRVVHEKRLPMVEGQMVSFPKGAHDDLVDAVSQGVDMFLGRKRKTSVTTASYA